MNAEESEKFNELYEKIAVLKIVKCRLNHERIRYDKKTDLPLAGCLPEFGYTNIGFCPPEIRAQRLACGHTMARYELENALSHLASNGVEIENLQTDLREVTNRIHRLDHQKGFAEKHLAQLVEKKYSEPENDLTEAIEQAKFSIRDIEDQHDECAEKIGQVRDLIIGQMKLFI